MVYLRNRLATFIRQERGRTPQREFARRLGVAQSTIMRIENCDQNVTLNTLEQLCRAFRVDVGDLFPPARSPRGYAQSRPAPVRQTVLHEPEAKGSPVSPSRKRGRKPRGNQSE